MLVCTTYDSQMSESNVPCTACGAWDSLRVKLHFYNEYFLSILRKYIVQLTAKTSCEMQQK